jgi:carnitine-CoA ligase
LSPVLEDIFRHRAVALPYFRVPRYIEFAPDLPTNATGKVEKDPLRSRGMTARQVDLKGLGLVMARSERRSQSSV